MTKTLIVVGLALVTVAQAGPVMAGAPVLRSWSQQLKPSKRFTVLKAFANAAVLDNETGLVWERDPGNTSLNWLNAHIHCNQFPVGGRKGFRLPTVEELATLVDPSVPLPGPTLPVGHPFVNIHSSTYWSATTDARDANSAWVVGFESGDVISGVVAGLAKTDGVFVWCVRGGRGVDPE